MPQQEMTSPEEAPRGLLATIAEDEANDDTTLESHPSHSSNYKRRHSAISWEDLARRGNRFKSFFQDVASDAVVQAKRFKKATIQEEEEEENDENTTNVPPSSFSNLNKLVEEQTVDNMQLRRSLENVQSERTTLETTQKSLQDEVNYWKNRHSRTSEALRIAEKNAQAARSDADLAETNAAQLASTLQSLQTVVSETKLASQKLSEEQALVDRKATDLEHKYLTQKQELLRVTKESESLRQTNALLEHARDQWKHERKTLEHKVKLMQGTIDTLRRELSDQTALEEIRKERAAKDQSELQEAQKLLTSATQQQETTLQVQHTLQETIQTLEKANQEMHEKLTEQEDSARTDNERLSSALTKAEREAQKLRMDKESLEEELKRSRQDKDASAKQIQELKQRVVAAERNHQPLLTTTPKTPGSNNNDTENEPNKICFRLPPIPGSAKSATASGTNNPDVVTGKSCCICFKPSFGIMRACQCGNCQKRGHIMCVKQVAAPPSVSHPGTPAPPLPVVLCKLNRLVKK